jgi:hypothetical protein
MARTKVEEYRQRAQECLHLAGMMTSPEHRAVLVAMAQAWKLLAQFHCLAEPQEYRHNQTLLPHNQVASM